MPFFHQVYYQFQKNSTLHLSLDENLIFDKDLDEYEIFKGDALIALEKKFVFDKSKNDVQFYLILSIGCEKRSSFVIIIKN